MDEFLESTDIIDWRHESVVSLAQELSCDSTDEILVARRCFEWVRDEVEHSVDFQREEITCRASEVLAKQTGFCYAKSHLLAALLRANGIPAGFCYQRLSVNDDGSPYCLHGLNAVYLNDFGWYRADARGNRDSVQAEFSPPVERLSFSASAEGEADFPEIHAAPLPCVLDSLANASSVSALCDNLPDVEPPISA